MAYNEPRTGLPPLVCCARLVAFGSTTQDIALDSFRIESTETRKQAALAAAPTEREKRLLDWSLREIAVD